jgi:hypothetical protein
LPDSFVITIHCAERFRTDGESVVHALRARGYDADLVTGPEARDAILRPGRDARRRLRVLLVPPDVRAGTLETLHRGLDPRARGDLLVLKLGAPAWDVAGRIATCELAARARRAALRVHSDAHTLPRARRVEAPTPRPSWPDPPAPPLPVAVASGPMVGPMGPTRRPHARPVARGSLWIVAAASIAVVLGAGIGWAAAQSSRRARRDIAPSTAGAKDLQEVSAQQPTLDRSTLPSVTPSVPESGHVPTTPHVASIEEDVEGSVPTTELEPTGLQDAVLDEEIVLLEEDSAQTRRPARPVPSRRPASVPTSAPRGVTEPTDSTAADTTEAPLAELTARQPPLPPEAPDPRPPPPPDPVAPVGAEVSASAGASPMAAPTAEL